MILPPLVILSTIFFTASLSILNLVPISTTADDLTLILIILAFYYVLCIKISYDSIAITDGKIGLLVGGHHIDC